MLCFSRQGKQISLAGVGIFLLGIITGPETGLFSVYLINSVSKIFAEPDFRLDFIYNSPSII